MVVTSSYPFTPPPRQHGFYACQGVDSCGSIRPSSSKSQLEINAEKKIRTIVKLKLDSEALNRRAANFAQIAESSKSSNHSKAQRVIDHCQKMAVDQEARYLQLEAEDATRNMIIRQRWASERMRLDCVGDDLQSRTSNAAGHREKRRQEHDQRMRKKVVEDDAKLRRKSQTLQSVIESRNVANERKAEKVAEHRAHYAELQEDRSRRIQAADDARASCIREREGTERQRLELASCSRQHCSEEAAEARRRMTQALEQRIAYKQAKDDDKIFRKFQQLENESLRLQEQGRIREQRVQKKKEYDDLVEQALAIADL